MLEKKKLKNKRLFISILIITALLSLSTVIIYQYSKYNQVESRLKTAYTSTNFQSSTLYKLFSTFSEAEYQFRLYSISFDKKNYNAYTQKLDSIKVVMDSLSTLPIVNNPIKNTEIHDHKIGLEYLLLKKQVDHLVLYAKDTMSYFIDFSAVSQINNKYTNLIHPDSIINKILKDSTFNTVKKDTIIKEKDNLFNRVFKAKDDTIITNNITQNKVKKQIDIALRKNIERFIDQNERANKKSINKLKASFEELQTKERELLLTNYLLLNNLKIGIERLKELEFEDYKKNQEADFLVYNENSKAIKSQLIIALSLMVLMVILILSYQRQVYFYERKLIKEKKYADQIAEEKTSVLANISHEIRTPLNSLKGLVNIIKNNYTDNNIDKEIIQSIDHDITVINSTINDILSLSKLESESLQIKNEQIIIHNLIEDLISLHTYQANFKNITIINNNKISKITLIQSNPFRIKQVISNLITNAIKYTEKGQITISSHIQNDINLIVKIQDTGIGISKEQGDQIFRKYYVADNKAKTGGFGLGLYISKILSDQIGGKLHFTSTLGRGTTFTFELPLSGTKNSIIEQASEHLIKEIPDDLNIIFIDDSKISLFFLQQLFKDKKNIHFFIDPSEALNYIKSNNVNIVVTDLKMPKISGWEILSIIKSEPTLHHIKVFASTAEPLLLEYNKGQFNFDGVINKPVKESEIVSKILNN